MSTWVYMHIRNGTNASSKLVTNTDYVSSVASPHTGKGLYSSEEALIFEA